MSELRRVFNRVSEELEELENLLNLKFPVKCKLEGCENIVPPRDFPGGPQKVFCSMKHNQLHSTRKYGKRRSAQEKLERAAKKKKAPNIRHATDEELMSGVRRDLDDDD